ncbi:MAG: hypothetical protein WC341_16840 [Bacteroidales bacterium]
MKITHICPKAKKPVEGKIVGNGTMEREEWLPVDDGLSGAQTFKWKTIIVKCGYCGETHEYALVMNPKV